MKLMRVHTCLSVVALALAAPRARGDDASLPEAELSPRTSFSVTAGGAWAPPLRVFGGVHEEGRKTGLLQLQVRRTLDRSEGHVLEWFFAVVPVELESATPVSTPSSGQPPGRSTVYGAGINPLGLSMRFGHGPWRPFWNLSGGVRMFADRVPVPRGTNFNFTADVGVGVYRPLSSRLAVTIGLDLHHVSNGNLGEKNPGVNYLLLTMGFLPTR
jgi:lipid A 3-O-deacylase PagL